MIKTARPMDKKVTFIENKILWGVFSITFIIGEMVYFR